MASAEGKEKDEEIGLHPPSLVPATLHDNDYELNTITSTTDGSTRPLATEHDGRAGLSQGHVTEWSGKPLGPSSVSFGQSTSSGTIMPSRAFTWRTTLSTSTLLLVLGVVGALPRSLLLLYLKVFVPTVPLPAGLYEFRQMWAPCTHEDEFWTNHSPGGLFWRVIIGSDHFFIIFGQAGAMMAFHWTILPVSFHTRPGKIIVFLAVVLTFMASVAVFSGIVVVLNNPRNNSLTTIDDALDWKENPLYIAVWNMAVPIQLILYSAGVAYTFIFPISVPQAAVVSRSNVISAARYGVMLLFTTIFSISMTTLQIHMAVQGLTGGDRAWTLIIAQIISKVLTGGLRTLHFTHHKNANYSVSMCIFVVHASTSLASRKLLLSFYEGDLLIVLLISIVFSLIEMLAQLTIGALQLVKMGTSLHESKLNCLTLSSLVDLQAIIESRITAFVYYLYADQVHASAYAHARVQACKVIS